jgi:hypothetical protein
MKKLFILMALGGIALGPTALGKDRQDKSAPVGRGNARASAVSNARAPMQRHVSQTPLRHTFANRPARTGKSIVRDRPAVRNNVARFTRRTRGKSNATIDRNRNAIMTNDSRTGRFRVKNSANARVAVNRNRNATVTNNWRGDRFSGRNYAVFRDYHRRWHDRDWWRHHYSRIIFVDGGWWYWDAGYWFPAWGYDPYAYYSYDGPIYGYANLTPDQIVVEVQTQLQRDGYYAGPIDGILGPMTRQGLAAFQADHGLAITSTVDEPTLDTLGLS